MHDSIDSIDYKGCTIEVCLDDNPSSPREWDNLGIMVCFHKRYDLGDKTDLKSSMFGSWNELERHLLNKEKALIVLPLYMFDHSGITIDTDPTRFAQADSAGWDWGQIGFIYTTREKIMAAFTDGRKKKNLTKKMIDKAAKILRSEVETYDQYVKGEVYGYIALDEDGENVGSCWGFFGDEGREYMIDEAKAEIDAHLESKKKDPNQVELFEEANG